MAHNKVVNNCSNLSPEASLTSFKNYCVDPQNFSQIGDQAPVDTRNENTTQWQAQVAQNDPDIEAAPKASEVLFNEKSQDALLYLEQSMFLSGQAERLLQNDKIVDFEGWNIDDDMDTYDEWNIDGDMDKLERSSMNPDMAVWNLDLNMDLFTNN